MLSSADIGIFNTFWYKTIISKRGKKLLQNESATTTLLQSMTNPVILKWGKLYFKMGWLIQSRSVFSKWENYFKVSYNKILHERKYIKFCKGQEMFFQERFIKQ